MRKKIPDNFQRDKYIETWIDEVRPDCVFISTLHSSIIAELEASGLKNWVSKGSAGVFQVERDNFEYYRSYYLRIKPISIRSLLPTQRKFVPIKDLKSGLRPFTVRRFEGQRQFRFSTYSGS